MLGNMIKHEGKHEGANMSDQVGKGQDGHGAHIGTSYSENVLSGGRVRDCGETCVENVLCALSSIHPSTPHPTTTKYFPSTDEAVGQPAKVVSPIREIPIVVLGRSDNHSQPTPTSSATAALTKGAVTTEPEAINEDPIAPPEENPCHINPKSSHTGKEEELKESDRKVESTHELGKEEELKESDRKFESTHELKETSQKQHGLGRKPEESSVFRLSLLTMASRDELHSKMNAAKAFVPSRNSEDATGKSTLRRTAMEVYRTAYATAAVNNSQQRSSTSTATDSISIT